MADGIAQELMHLEIAQYLVVHRMQGLLQLMRTSEVAAPVGFNRCLFLLQEALHEWPSVSDNVGASPKR